MATVFWDTKGEYCSWSLKSMEHSNVYIVRLSKIKNVYPEQTLWIC